MRKALEGLRQTRELFMAGIGGGCVFAFRGAMIVTAARAKAYSARFKRFAQERAHVLDVLLCGRFMGQCALFHDIHPQRVVWHLDQKVEAAG